MSPKGELRHEKLSVTLSGIVDKIIGDSNKAQINIKDADDLYREICIGMHSAIGAVGKLQLRKALKLK